MYDNYVLAIKIIFKTPKQILNSWYIPLGKGGEALHKFYDGSAKSKVLESYPMIGALEKPVI